MSTTYRAANSLDHAAVRKAIAAGLQTCKKKHSLFRVAATFAGEHFRLLAALKALSDANDALLAKAVAAGVALPADPDAERRAAEDAELVRKIGNEIKHSKAIGRADDVGLGERVYYWEGARLELETARLKNENEQLSAALAKAESDAKKRLMDAARAKVAADLAKPPPPPRLAGQDFYDRVREIAKHGHSETTCLRLAVGFAPAAYKQWMAAGQVPSLKSIVYKSK